MAVQVGLLQEWSERARAAVGVAGEGAARAYSDARDAGLVPGKMTVRDDGAFIPPAYVWWAPWAARAAVLAVVVIVAGVAGIALIPDPLGVTVPGALGVALVAGLMIAAAGFNSDSRWAWGACVFLFPVAGALLLKSFPMGIVLALLGALAASLGGVYRRADFDAATVDALEQIADAKRSHGRGFLVEEIIQDAGGHEKTLTLGDLEGGPAHNRRVRHIPDGIEAGWYIVVDPARRFMAGMSPAMLRRIEKLEVSS